MCVLPYGGVREGERTSPSPAPCHPPVAVGELALSHESGRIDTAPHQLHAARGRAVTVPHLGRAIELTPVVWVIADELDPRV